MSSICAYHNSRELCCRSPFGAVPAGTSVTLRLFIWGDDAASAHVTLRLWFGEERFSDGEDHWENGRRVIVFHVSIPRFPCVVWYNFRVNLPSGMLYVGVADGLLRSGESTLTCGIPHDFRITVFDPDFHIPEAFKGKIAYQIFPDRFKRGCLQDGFDALALHRKLGWRVTEKNWNEEVDFLPRGNEKHYSPADFYMGNFNGIIEEIPLLKSLGVSVLYLNPIFLSPYNHRYSISNYMQIDPILGSEEDFSHMAALLKQNGIRIILDGVFSHTGDDSIYFDHFGKFGGGAFLDPDSPYRDWFDFSASYSHGYKCWWDFDSLPEVIELNPSYMEYISRVLEKWLRLGASGWRLDVADELPDEFIKFLRTRIKAIDPEAILIGEVWEDAALKTDGMGRRREYVNGAELDGVMDYPFLKAVSDFLLGNCDSYRLKAVLGSQTEGYPAEFMRGQLGILGSHDTRRILSVLSGAPGRDELSMPDQARWTPSPEMYLIGKKRLAAASALQFSMPFMPCIYYGDEAGSLGMADPFCRRPYPWGREDMSLLEHYKKLASARLANAVFIHGNTAFAAPHKDVFAISRSASSEVITVVNRSDASVSCSLSPDDFSEGEAPPTLSGAYTDAVSSQRFIADGGLAVLLPPFGCLMLIRS